ncbi:MAG: hypothetical protein Q4F72_04295 [Desulfovibrionaceae bacterium]|nr:hypothetical protein [Desulfovibrionaceae bacterium]
MHRFASVLCLVLTPALLLTGCTLFKPDMTPNVVNTPDYVRLLHLVPQEMQRQRLADSKLAYLDAGKPSGQFGPAIYRQVSPDFMFGEQGHDIYLGETFHATETPLSRYYPDKDGQGFAIVHLSQRLAMRMLARVDWNHDGKWDWLMRCTVETFKGSRVRHYYVLAPEPANPREMVHGTILAVVDDRGYAAPVVQVRDTRDYGKAAEEMPLTEVIDGLPGDLRMTEPPSKQVRTGGVQERSL